MEPPVQLGPSVDGDLVVLLRGEIDYSNAATVSDVVLAAVGGERPGAVRIDMGRVTFLDSSGINVLVRVYRAAVAGGAAYRIVGASAFVYDQLAMTGLPDLFDVEPPVPAP